MFNGDDVMELPTGWRWLNVGEEAMPGDYLCDRRAKSAVEIECGFEVIASTHPIRTKRNYLTPKALRLITTIENNLDQLKRELGIT